MKILNQPIYNNTKLKRTAPNINSNNNLIYSRIKALPSAQFYSSHVAFLSANQRNATSINKIAFKGSVEEQTNEDIDLKFEQSLKQLEEFTVATNKLKQEIRKTEKEIVVLASDRDVQFKFNKIMQNLKSGYDLEQSVHAGIKGKKLPSQQFQESIRSNELVFAGKNDNFDFEQYSKKYVDNYNNFYQIFKRANTDSEKRRIVSKIAEAGNFNKETAERLYKGFSKLEQSRIPSINSGNFETSLSFLIDHKALIESVSGLSHCLSSLLAVKDILVGVSKNDEDKVFLGTVKLTRAGFLGFAMKAGLGGAAMLGPIGVLAAVPFLVGAVCSDLSARDINKSDSIIHTLSHPGEFNDNLNKLINTILSGNDDYDNDRFSPSRNETVWWDDYSL